MEKNRSCPVCGDELVGRIDKKFCSDQCRTEFSNRNNKEWNNNIRKVNGILRKNRRILAELNPEGKSKTSKQRLIDKGFNFNYFTNIYVTKTGNTYHFCYEYGYLALQDNYYALVTRE